ncbi:RhuM family protein [uncultured Vibrio sp.]|uniref:RhuM family protein n=1 Tax=uncultured Vibrio sp. TaxID=114054 RepID=UPI0025E604A4|nr:RhuM family protein [uncultured Vibrio sp.]
MNKNNEVIIYTDEGYDSELVMIDGKLWTSFSTLSQMFSTTILEVTPVLTEIFNSGELSRIEHARKEDDDWYFSVDAIISVGYRLNSQKATQFRVWSTNTLARYVTDGYLINDDILKSDPKKLSELAAKIRELRANEKNIYASVRECFKIAASDYEPSSNEVRSFYSLLQDKFHHAITKMTSSQLVLDRANHTDINMGLQSFNGLVPTKSEVRIGKNYLNETEMYRMHLLSEQFLLFAESTALGGQNMTMNMLHTQLDKLLQLNGYEVFDGYSDYIKEHALEHANSEYETFLEIKKLAHLGIDVDLDLFYMGEYEELKSQTEMITTQQINKALALRVD